MTYTVYLLINGHVVVHAEPCRLVGGSLGYMYVLVRFQVNSVHSLKEESPLTCERIDLIYIYIQTYSFIPY